MANNQQITLLLQKFVDGSISKTEYDELISHFKLSGNDEEIFAAMDGIWKTTGADEFHSQEETDFFYHKLVHSEEFRKTRPGVNPRMLWYRLAVAAMLLISLSAGFYFWNASRQNASRLAARKEIGPGGNKAFLTLANGRVINLSDADTGKLASQANMVVSKTKSGQLLYHLQSPGKGDSNAFNTISTPRGGQYTLLLSDGSRVFLNAASSFTYPVAFSGKTRKVQLNGEAYFEVAHNKAMPFHVESKGQDVEVLGTHFNINSYTDEPGTKTTLLEGSVRINESTVLKPGDQSTLSKTGTIAVAATDVDEAVAWKNGKFIFQSEDIKSVMRKLARWYDVDVDYQDSFNDQSITGSVSRFDNISKVLDKITYASGVHFKMEGRRISVIK